MILNEENEGWHYFVITKLLALLRGITSKHNPDFYCLNSLHSFAIKKIQSHEKCVKIKIFVKLFCQPIKIMYLSEK